MIDRLDVVTVGIEDEGGVVAGVVVRALAGRAVIRAAGLERRAIELGDLLLAYRAKGQMDSRRLWLAGADPEVAAGIVAPPVSAPNPAEPSNSREMP